MMSNFFFFFSNVGGMWYCFGVFLSDPSGNFLINWNEKLSILICLHRGLAETPQLCSKIFTHLQMKDVGLLPPH